MSAIGQPQAERKKQFADDLPDPLRSDAVTAKVIRDRIWRPPNREDNWAAFCMVGREGSGKSLTTASILEKCDPTFDADRVFYSPEAVVEFIAGLDDAEREGKAVMLDEAGVGMGVRTWYDQDQVKVNKAAQTMRDDNMIFGLTLPSFALLDSQLRTRMHGFCEMRGLKRDDHASWSWKDIIVNREEGGKEIKRKQFPRHYQNGRVHRVTRLKIAPPTDDFIEVYKQGKAEFKQELYEEVFADEEEDESQRGPKEIAQEILDEESIEQYTSVHGGRNEVYVDKDKIYMAYESLTHQEAQMIKKLLADEWEPEGET